MKKLFFIVLCLSVMSLYGQTNFTQYVNPFIGTDFHGHTYPGAIVPFGGIQLSPDTRLDGWDGCSGYHYSDNVVYGFSHTHLSGTGVSDFGDVLVMPFTGTPSVINSEYCSPFSHKNETAHPGYYSVVLDKNNIKVELTATKRVGVHRYTFPNGNNSKGIILDLKHRDVVLHSAIQYVKENNKVVGSRDSRAWNENQKLDFSMLFSVPIKKIEFYVNDQLVDSTDGIKGKNCKAVIFFADDVKEVVVKVALSGVAVDLYDADKNHVEVPDFNFDRVRKEADRVWNAELGKIEVETENPELKTIFYTALYHCFTSPYIFNDVDNRYRGLDGNIHEANGHDVYTVFSLWDTYRALHPLLTLIDRKRTSDFIYTFMQHYEQGGMLPVWELAGFETWCMIGYHSVPVILEAFKKGILDDYSTIEKKKVLDAMVSSAKLNKLGRPEFAQYGYIPGEKEHESVSKTLEYAYDDWCIAQFAKAIGEEDIYNEFIRRAQYYKNIMDENGFMHPKINGGFLLPFNPTEINNHFTEANSWQYSTYAPHDIFNYIKLIGGDAVFEQFLDSLFYTSAQTTGRDQADVTGLIGQYAHGNEPSHHAAYLYSYIGKPWKTQQLVRHILSTLYTIHPDGLCGNEDCGQMSAWYVLSSMGFYPVCPGDNQYIIGSPIFDKVTINLENGKKFVVVCNQQSDDNCYVKSASLNGKKFPYNYLIYDDIKDGGILEFTMSNKPNQKWGKSDKYTPASSVAPTLTISPQFIPHTKSFKGETTITISLYKPAKQSDKALTYPYQTDVIYYTTDGSMPTKKSAIYTEPIKITENTLFKAVAYNSVTGFSQVTEAQYFKFSRDKKIKLNSNYHPLYTADGDDGLIDNVRGASNFRLGGWQGYQGQDFEAVVDLSTVKDINQVGAGFLQDIRSWIFYPTTLTVEISDDNIHFEPYGTFANPYPSNDYNSSIHDFIITKAAKARYIKVKATYFGKLPEWHLSAGEQSYIFIDEIIIN